MLLLLTALAGSAACGSPGVPHPSPEPSFAPPSDRPTTPAELCTSLVGYWVKEALRGNKWAGIDWEQKGLSNEQYGIHEAVLAEARTEQRKNGTAAAERLADRRVGRRCEAQRGATGSSENWREPRRPTPDPSSGATARPTPAPRTAGTASARHTPFP